MSKLIDLARVREEVAHIVREMGMTVHHCEEAIDRPSLTNPAQMADVLNSAADASRMLTEHATRLELFIEAAAAKAEQLAKGGAK